LRYELFRRIFQLPRTVSPDQIEAEVDKGLLRIRVKRVTKQAEPRKISVHGAESPHQKAVERTGDTEQAQSDTQQATSVPVTAGDTGAQMSSEPSGESTPSYGSDSTYATTDSSGQASSAEPVGAASTTSDMSADAMRSGSSGSSGSSGCSGSEERTAGS
jgi:hypothetical protein